MANLQVAHVKYWGNATLSGLEEDSMKTYDRALLEAVFLASFVGAPMSITASRRKSRQRHRPSRELGR